MEDKFISAENFLNCVICLQLADEAVSCGQCANVMCDKCYKGLKKQECPLCRKTHPEIKPNMLARRMIGSLPASCSLCQFKTTMGNLLDHQKKCEMRQIECGFDKCNYIGNEKEFIQHIIEMHSKELLSKF